MSGDSNPYKNSYIEMAQINRRRPSGQNIIESECNVIISCPLYEDMRRDIFYQAAQLDINYNTFVYLFSAPNICFTNNL